MARAGHLADTSRTLRGHGADTFLRTSVTDCQINHLQARTLSRTLADTFADTAGEYVYTPRCPLSAVRCPPASRRQQT